MSAPILLKEYKAWLKENKTNSLAWPFNLWMSHMTDCGDMRLRNAAPDLLKACQEAYAALLSLKQAGDHKDWEAFEPLHKAFKMTEAAIKQAKG